MGCCILEPAFHSELGVSSGRFPLLCCLSSRLGLPCVLVAALGRGKGLWQGWEFHTRGQELGFEESVLQQSVVGWC